MEIQFKTGLPVTFTKNDGKIIYGRILCNVYEDKEKCLKDAIKFSIENNIVESKEWANKCK